MSFQIKEPILIVGLGGVGSKLAIQAKNILNLDYLIISNEQRDLPSDLVSIKISTEPVVNPSIQLIRGSTYKVIDEIRAKISRYSTIILMTNMAGKAGSAISPVVSEICKESDKGLISFAIMPFRYEKDRIFNSGISLKRIRENSQCTVVLDNDSLLESNPDLSPKQCYDIANNAIMHVVKSLGSSEIATDTSILTASKDNAQNIEESLRDSLKMLYSNAPSNSIKRSMLYVVGGDNIPVGVLSSITDLTSGVLNKESQINTISGTTDESKVVMLSSIQGMTKFDNYDPLGIIPQQDTLDWSRPDCSIDCQLDLYQLE
ncbi:MAG: cell division protein FtsZ [Nitrosopumilus sp.]|nr:cell division protein FtsZ [Nitrosopumilus sp.]